MLQKKKRPFKRKLKIILWSSIIFSIVLFVVASEHLSIYEGNIAILFYLLNAIIINIIIVAILIFFKRMYVSREKCLGLWDIIVCCFYTFFGAIFFIFIILSTNIPAYHLLFDKKIITTTNNYTVLEEVESIGRGGGTYKTYHIVFDNETKLRINKHTYNHLKDNHDYKLTIVYKPTVKVLHDLQISSK